MRISGLGHALFGVSVMGLSALGLAYGDFKPLLEPFPALLPQPHAWAYGSAAILLVTGVGLLFGRTALVSVTIVAAFGLIWLITRARALFVGPLNIGSLYGVFEALGPLIGAWILYALLCRQYSSPAPGLPTGNGALRVARILFGISCIEYGAAHFAYAAYTASMVPAWLPAPTGIAYLTGALHAAAGLGLVFGICPRLAATMEGTMMCLFGVLVWLPTFFSHHRPAWASPTEVQWSETALTFLLASSALIVAASVQDDRRGLAPRERDGLG